MTLFCADPTEIRRARPLLGTIVEITAEGCQESVLTAAVDVAFAAVDKVQRLMSYHDATSELSQLNRAAHLGAILVSPWTFAVLRVAQRLAAESDGVFDVTIAPQLAAWRYLPQISTTRSDELQANWRDVELRSDRQVFFRRPLHIDLGGIAKGFAVDRAVEALLRCGVSSGLVNAGGDLRAFGPRDWPVQIRCPHDGQPGGHTFAVCAAAVATSATYFSRKKWRQGWVSPLVDGTTRQACEGSFSVSVYAPTALLADALTKIVVVRREHAASILQRYDASALLLDGIGRRQFVAV
ncbi:MAG TPA: FAD:protein FMN transferase [Chthoniobacterales bacterium]